MLYFYSNEPFYIKLMQNTLKDIFHITSIKNSEEILKYASYNPVVIDVDQHILSTLICSPLQNNLLFLVSPREQDLLSLAQNFILKPVALETLIPRINALIINTELHLPCGLIYIPQKRLLKIPNTNKALALTEKESNLLLALYKAPNYFLDKKVLLSAVWQYNTLAETHTLETHVSRLNKKVTKDLGVEVFIRKDQGYVLSNS